MDEVRRPSRARNWKVPTCSPMLTGVYMQRTFDGDGKDHSKSVNAGTLVGTFVTGHTPFDTLRSCQDIILNFAKMLMRSGSSSCRQRRCFLERHGKVIARSRLGKLHDEHQALLGTRQFWTRAFTVSTSYSKG